MANTTNYNWETPDDTDLVKDGAAAIRTLGSSIDTTTKNLNPSTTLGDIEYRSATANTNARLAIGTTGQILSVVGGVPAWVANDVGDITAVTAGTGISGGGTSGDVTITNSMATAIDAKGDLIAGTGADTFSRLEVGTNGHTLVADSSTATGLAWSAPAGVSLVGAALTKSGSQSLGNATGVIIDWDTELFDTDGFHSGSSSRLTVPTGKGGKYLVGCMGKFAANATGYRNTNIRLNGTTYINGSSGANVGASGSAQTINIFARSFSAGDYIEVDAFQNSGGNLNFESSDSNSTFYMIFLGA